MDPISFVPFVLTLITISEKICAGITDIALRYKSAATVLNTTQTEIETLLEALNGLSTLCSESGGDSASNSSFAPEVITAFENALMSCMTVVSSIDREIAKLGRAQSYNWAINLRFVWVEGSMKRLVSQLRGQRDGINLLIQGVQVEDLRTIKRSQKKTLSLLHKKFSTSFLPAQCPASPRRSALPGVRFHSPTYVQSESEQEPPLSENDDIEATLDSHTETSLNRPSSTSLSTPSSCPEVPADDHTAISPCSLPSSCDSTGFFASQPSDSQNDDREVKMPPDSDAMPCGFQLLRLHSHADYLRRTMSTTGMPGAYKAAWDDIDAMMVSYYDSAPQ